MKPLKLTLSAFNAFADTQTIDFSDLGGSGLYLITGETGSGKTTIFDAVSFALFGKASGSGRDDYAMLRSDFADGKIKTYVELDFMSGSSLYNIKRTIKRIGQDKTAQDVVLTLPDGTTLSGDRNIKPKIIEIVGLDRDQFTQIVMIAQNDFLRFLQSGTDERVKILRRIFGTEKMKTFQERLKALAKAECEKRDLIIHDFSRYGIDVYKRHDHFAQWETQVAACKTELTNLDHQLNEWDKTKQTLAADLALAEDLSRKFADLLALHTSLETHRNKTGHMAAVRERAARGEAALRKVKPLADEAAKATVHHRTSQANLTAAREQENAAQTELEQVTQEIRALPSLAEAQAALALLIKNWTGATENLKKLKTLQINRADIVNKQATLAKERTELAAALQTLAELPPLANSQAELDQVTQALSNSRDNLTKLTSLQSDLSVITEKQQRLAAAQTEFAALSTAFTVANNEYMAIE
ncbi:MAG: SMC family ATPase, partial [Gracilibacteraceae bacterium]|nr:SMC family ATPase [Gracilibacteraceae bacterium]